MRGAVIPQSCHSSLIAGSHYLPERSSVCYCAYLIAGSRYPLEQQLHFISRLFCCSACKNRTVEAAVVSLFYSQKLCGSSSCCRWVFCASYLDRFSVPLAKTGPWKQQLFRCFTRKDCAVVAAAAAGSFALHISTVFSFRLRKPDRGSSSWFAVLLAKIVRK